MHKRDFTEAAKGKNFSQFKIKKTILNQYKS